MPTARPFQLLMIFATVFSFGISKQCSAAEPNSVPGNFSQNKLVAWCIVPFDAKKRGPEARSQMVADLGLTRIAYDWRTEHIPQFEDEIQQYQKRNLEFFAFWSWHDSLEPLIKKYDIHPQIWLTNPSPDAATQEEKVKAAAQRFLPLATKTKKLGCKLGLYNHGGWGGEPANLVAVCEYLRVNHDANHVGIVYNFHHGHGHIEDFESELKIMLPYLHCLNLNGMASPATVQGHTNKILPIGDGQHEAAMIQTIIDSGYKGPIGILDHRSELDSKKSLKLNIDGLKKVLAEVE